MRVHPFIEAEEVAGHSVQRACRLLEVSRSAYYERTKAVPSARRSPTPSLTEKITAIHTESKGTYGSPRVHKELVNAGVACGRRRVRASCARPASRDAARSAGARPPCPIPPPRRPGT